MRALPTTVPLTLMLLVSCRDANEPTPNSLVPVTIDPAAAVSRIHFTEGFLVHTIPDHGLFFTVGLLAPIADFCAGEPVEFDVRGTSQTVETPAGPVKLLDRITGTFVLYDAVLPDPAEFCGLATAPIIATGPGRFTRNDNSLTGVGPGNNSFGFRANAMVELTGGGKAHFHAVIRQHFDGENVTTIVDKVELKPIGN